MNKNFKYFFLILTITLLALSVNSYKNIEKEELLMNIVFRHLEATHFSPQNMNDDFSIKAFNTIIKRMDYGKRFFYKSDILLFSKYSKDIDDECKNGQMNFFNLIYNTIYKRTIEVEGFYKGILQKPFNFNKKEFIETDGEKLQFVKSSKELKTRWRRLLKYKALRKIADRIDTEKKLLNNPDTIIIKKTFKVHEEEVRAELLKSQKIWFKRMLELEKSDRFSVYLNSIITVFGPHSVYMPPKSKEDFDIHITGSLEGIGAQLQQKDEYIKVVSIVPGSASARQGDLKAGDIILKVAQADSEAVDITDMRLDKAVRFIRGPKGSEVRLTVRKVDGISKVISIIRDVVILEASYAKSLIIQDSLSNYRAGYIKLPGFYADFRRSGGRNCAEDVKKEIIKLKKSKINGLILDLRNNGGGSLSEAVDMTGLFIKDGPVVQVKAKKNQPQVLKDTDSHIEYSGPLLILVNEGSASASEILAAAIQDYGRGVIVGSSTFGKGTVQRIFDLDQYLNGGFKNLQPLGALKVTMQKFYRINGGATQVKGVKSDICLPGIYDSINIGEKEQDFAMQWDEILPCKYNNQNLDFIKIKNNSIKRIKKNKKFQTIVSLAKNISTEKEKTNKSINLKSYQVSIKKSNKYQKTLEENDNEIENFKIFNILSDLKILSKDSIKQKLNKEWINGLKKDIYLYESLNIVKDLSKITKK